jgi:hypothetical protein
MSLDVDAFRAVNILDDTAFKDKRIHLKEEKPLIARAQDILAQIDTKDERTFGNRPKTH